MTKGQNSILHKANIESSHSCLSAMADQEAHSSRQGMFLEIDRKAAEEALTRLPVSAE